MKTGVTKLRIFLVTVLLTIATPLLYSCTDQYADIISQENNGDNGGGTITGWTRIGTVATPRKNMAAVMIDNTLYFYGGDNGTVMLNELWSVNLTDYTAVQLSSNAYLTRGSLFATSDALYTIAGKEICSDATSTAECVSVASSSVYKYDIATDTWSTITTSDTNENFISARYSPSYFTRVETTSSVTYYKFFLIGGYDSYDTPIDEIYSLTVQVPATTITSSATVKPRWSNSTYGVALARSVSYMNGDIIYTMSGINDTGYSRGFYQYSISDSSLTSGVLPDVIPSSEGAAIVGNDQYLYLFGGRENLVENDALWRYDIVLGTWKKLSSQPQARFAHILVYFNGKIYLFGGADMGDNYFNDLWVYDPALDSLK